MMENKDMISKNKTKHFVILLAVIFLVCSAGIGSLYAWKTKKNDVSQKDDVILNQTVIGQGEALLDENGMPEDGSDITETRNAHDVETLRKLLLEEGKFAIKLTKDIRIERGFQVIGTKKLVGNKSITMELYAEPFQPILKVLRGGTLILDGITLDGNSNATGVEVDEKAGFTSLSGSILYPIPHGVLNHGTTRIVDIKIDKGIDSGLCVTGSGKAYMEGGEISGCSKAAVHVVAEGYVKISGETKLNDSYMCINNRGTCEITGGVLSDAWRTLVWNLADLTIDYAGKTENDKLEWYNAGEYGVRSAEGTNTYINGLYIHDVAKGAIKCIKHDEMIVTNCKVENIGTYGVESAKGRKDAIIKDIEVVNSANSAVRVYGEHKIEVTNLTVTDTQGRGIQNGNATLIAKNVKIENSRLSGVYGGKGSTTEVSDIEIISSQRYGAENIGGTMTIKNAKIIDAKLSGVFCRKESVNHVSNTDIIRPGKRGIYNLGGTVTANQILVDSPVQYGVTSSSYDKVKGSLTISDLTVRNVAQESGINCNDSVMTAKNVTITNAKTYGARVIGGGKLTITDIKVQDCGMRGIAASNDNTILSVTNAEVKNTGMSGIMSGTGAIAKLENISIKNAGLTSGKDTNYTDSYRSALATTDGVIEAKQITIEDSIGNGVYVNGGTLTAEHVVINRPGDNGAFFTSSKTNGEAVIQMTDVNIQTPQNRGVYNDGGTAQLADVKITNPKNYGVTTAAYSKDYPGAVVINGLEIIGVQKKNALNCNASKMSVADGNISDVPEYGAYVLNNGNLTLKNVTFTDVAKRGVYSEEATATLQNVEITGTQYGVFVDGGTTTYNSGKVIGAGMHGIYVTSANHGLSTADIKAVTIHEATERGVYNYGGNTTLTDVTITDPGTYGVSTGKANWTVGEVTTTFDGKVVASNLNVTGVKGNNALNCNSSVLSVDGGTIYNVAKYGAYVVANGQLSLEGVHIAETGLSGVYAKSGSDIKLTKVTMDQVGVTNDTETSYDYQDKSGIGAVDATVSADGVTITNAVEDGIYIAGCISTLKNVKVYTAKYGLFMDGGKITEGSQNVEIYGATASGAYIKTTKEYGEAVAYMENLTVDEADKRAVYNVGAQITLTGTTTITDAGEYGVTSGKTEWTTDETPVSFAGKVAIADLTITGVDKHNALHCNASVIEVAGGTISNIKEYGARVVANGTLTMNRVAISNCEEDALAVQSGILTMTGGTITGTTGYDVNLYGTSGAASVTLTGVDITRAEGNKHGSIILERSANNSKTTTLTLDNCNLTGNGVPTSENAICVNNGILNIQNGGTYAKNVSGISGGVLYIASAGKVNINQCDTKKLVTFANNGCDSGSKASSGGVINVQDGGILKADTCDFTNNYVKCTGSGNCMGGAISVGNTTEGDVVIKNASFEGNYIQATAGYGGAVSVGTSCYLTMENCVFGQTTETANRANYGKDVRGAKNTEFNLSGKIIAEFYNTTNKHILNVVGALDDGSDIVMRWKEIGKNVSGKTVLSFANKELLQAHLSKIRLHEEHTDEFKLQPYTTAVKVEVK